MYKIKIFLLFILITLTTTACGDFNLTKKRSDLEEIQIVSAEIVNFEELLMPKEETFNVVVNCSDGINYLKVAFRGEEAQFYNIELERQHEDNCNFIIKPEYLKDLGRRIHVDVRAISKDFENDIESYEDKAIFVINNENNLYNSYNAFEINKSQLIVLNEQLKAIGEYYLNSNDELVLNFGATGDLDKLKIELKNVLSKEKVLIEKDFFENRLELVLDRNNLSTLGNQVFVNVKAFANDEFKDNFSFLLNIKNEELVAR